MPKFYYFNNDRAFKIVFTDEYRLKNLIARSMNVSADCITELVLLPNEQPSDFVDGKFIILDVAATIRLAPSAREHSAIVEMQDARQEYFVTRMYMQASRMVVDSVSIGGAWDSGTPAIGINFLNNPPKKIENMLFVKAGIYGHDADTDEFFLLDDIVTFYFFNLKEARTGRSSAHLSAESMNLVRMLSASTQEELDDLERCGDSFITDCIDRLRKANITREERDHIMERESNFIRMSDVDKKGEERGIIKKAIEVAKKMLLRGVPIDDIADITELDVDMVKKLAV